MQKIFRIAPVIFTMLFATFSLLAQEDEIEISEEEKKAFKETVQDTIAIKDSASIYEIVIIEPGFYAWLKSVARPEGYYSQEFLENRNQLFVLEWNRRALEPTRYGTNLYLWQIDYDATKDYGYDVNYKLYNYFIYFQRKYNQQLSPYLPRI